MPYPYKTPGLQKVDDPLGELRSQFNLKPEAAEQTGDAAPVDEKALSEGARTFYDPNFINAGRIKDANDGQGLRMATDLANKVGTEGKTAKDAVTGAISSFHSGVANDVPAFTYEQGSSPSARRQDLTGTPSTKSPSPSGMPTGAVPATTRSSSTGSTSQALGGTPQRGGSTPSTFDVGSGKSAPTSGGGTPGQVPGSTYSYAQGSATTTPPATTTTTPAASTSAGAYAGKESLLDAFPTLAEQAKVAGTDANQLGNDVTRQQSMQKLYGKNAGYYGTNSSGLDSFLAGAEGHDKLDAVKKEYGGLEDLVKSANAQSIADVAARRGRDTARADQAAKIAADRKGRLDAGIAAQQQQDRDQAAHDAQFAGRGSYRDYVSTNNAETTFKDASEAIDPIAWIMKKAGLRTWEDAVTPGMESWANEHLGTHLNSGKVRFQEALPNLTESEREHVFNSLTTAELRALEQMPQNQQIDWLMHRWEQLRKSALAGEDRQRVDDELNNPPHQIYA